MKTTGADSQLPLEEPESNEPEPCDSKAARLRVLRELVRSDNYHIPAMLIAERMIERAATPDDDRSD